jgi:glycosyltransferase involved in cell wall biosynthesis
MIRNTDLRKIAFVANYVPRTCGISTFTANLRNAVASQFPETECIVVPVNDIEGGYDYPPEVRFEFAEQDLDSYHRAADFLNFSNVDVVCLQHEYGIYGGPAGSHILALLRDVRVPVVTTLHTVLREPTSDQRRVLKRLAELSARIVVMAERGKTLLREVYDVPEQKIDLIAHGIPDIPFVDPSFYKDQFGVEGKFVALTFGLLSPSKGIEYVLQALPAITREFPDFVYIVLGATHPHLIREQGEAYRLGLERMAQDLGVKKHVIFYNRFVELHELMEFIGASDLYITPYLNPAQITSGTLAYAFGCGKAVVSTPYWHAEELLADGRGVLVPFANAGALAEAVIELLRDEPRRHVMRKRAYLLGREMIWTNVAHQYVDAFQQARRSLLDRPRRPLQVRTLDQRSRELPRVQLDHLLLMTDLTGLLQHACYTIPRFQEGYCTDDNARALVLTVLLEELGHDTPELRRLIHTYAAFLDYALVMETGRFRNFLGFDRRWLDIPGSDDSLGRAIWALGTCIGRSELRSLQHWAVPHFERSMAAVLETTSPRAWATALLGVHEYLRRLTGDRQIHQARDVLTAKLVDQFERVATDDWPWFEEVVAYENARLPHALILSGRWTSNMKVLELGLRILRWLAEVQTAPRGHFRPIGCNGFWRRGEPRAEFDQQPIEAQAMVSACIEAYRATDDDFWLEHAHLAFEWFLGRNDLGLPLYDPASGGCCDGLHEDRLNQNQGAESTLAFLTALAEIRLLDHSLVAFRTASQGEQSIDGLVPSSQLTSVGGGFSKP